MPDSDLFVGPGGPSWHQWGDRSNTNLDPELKLKSRQGQLKLKVNPLDLDYWPYGSLIVRVISALVMMKKKNYFFKISSLSHVCVNETVLLKHSELFLPRSGLSLSPLLGDMEGDKPQNEAAHRNRKEWVCRCVTLESFNVFEDFFFFNSLKCGIFTNMIWVQE